MVANESEDGFGEEPGKALEQKEGDNNLALEALNSADAEAEAIIYKWLSG